MITGVDEQYYKQTSSIIPFDEPFHDYFLVNGRLQSPVEEKR